MAGNFADDFAQFRQIIEATGDVNLKSAVDDAVSKNYPRGDIGYVPGSNIPGITPRQQEIALKQGQTRAARLLSDTWVNIRKVAQAGVSREIGPFIQEAGMRIGVMQRALKDPAYLGAGAGGMGGSLLLLGAAGLAAFVLFTKKGRKWLPR